MMSMLIAAGLGVLAVAVVLGILCLAIQDDDDDEIL